MSAILKGELSGSHWYTKEGKPFFVIEKKDGSGYRPVNSADAVRLNLLPSVTTKLNILSKPGLDRWKLVQVAEQAIKTPYQQGENATYYINNLIDNAFCKVKDACDLGTRIHKALENGVINEHIEEDMLPYVEPVLKFLTDKDIQITHREKIVVNREHGFAGTVDMLFKFGTNGIGIIDYKSRKTKPKEKIKPYDGQALQLAAYAATHYGEQQLLNVVAANIYISTTEIGRFDVYKHTDIKEAWETMKHVCAVWRYQTGYDPRG